MRRVLLISLLLAASWARAATYTAATCSFADVQTAYNSSASQDTVIVPNGSCNWSGSTLTVTHSVHIFGGYFGLNSGTTTITNSATIFLWQPANATEAGRIFEVAGFTFSHSSYGIKAYGLNGTTPSTSLKIHGNVFNGTGSGARAFYLNGMAFGPIYGNKFTGQYVAAWSGSCGTGTYTGADCGAYSHPWGSANYPYYENNVFGNGTGSFITETGQGGRMVFRHNSIIGYNCLGCEVFDQHGDQNTGDGTIQGEIYHNAVGTGSNVTRWLFHRGGGLMFLNNAQTGNNSATMFITEYQSWSNSGYGCHPYVATGQINDTGHGLNPGYYGGNTRGGSNQTPSRYCASGCGINVCGTNPPWGDNNYLQLNREWWTPSYGLDAALPATCTADGNTFYVATDTDKMYKCIATNTWSAAVADGGFTPYTYPHPLDTGPWLVPDRTSQDFGSQTVNTTSAAQTFTVVNYGGPSYNVSSIASSDGQFVILNDTCSGNAVALQASCTFQATFTPTTAGAKSSTVTITTTDPGSPQTVALTGTGTASTPPSQSTISSTPTPTVAPLATYTITWTCSDTPTAAVLDGVAQSAPYTGATTAPITMTGTTSHTIACTNANGSTQASVTVTQGGTVVGANVALGANTKIQ